MARPPRPWVKHSAHAPAFFWHGPANLTGSLRLEWRIVAARWFALLCVIPGLALLPLTPEQVRATTLIMLAGLLYNALIAWLIFVRPAFIARGYATTIGDLLLNSAMLLSLDGGFDSAYSSIFFALVVSVAMRFGQRAALGASGVVVAVNALANVATGIDFTPDFIFRGLFLCLTAILASFLREQAQRANADLQESNLALKGAYGELHETHQQLLSLDAAKTNFVANVSHELRTPLTSIRAYSELLLTYDDHPHVQREFLGIINAESERLTRLVGDVLDIMKIEAGVAGWRVAPVDIAELLRYTVQVYSPLAEQRGITLGLDLPQGLPPVRGDRDRLLQVFGNLVANGVKFTASGSITLTAETLDGELRVAVSDTGPGIAPEDQPHIFEKFYQGGRLLTDKPGGTGLGLAICKEIIDQYQGRIWVESTPGQGSTFVVALKPLPETIPTPPPSPESPHTIPGAPAGTPLPLALIS